MARYIDADYLFKCFSCRHFDGDECDTFCDSYECYSPDMSKIPTADVVEVVRCKDCIWFQPEFVLTPNGERRPYTEEELKNGRNVTMDVGINCGSRCERHGRWEENSIPVWYHEDDFCSYGKRKKVRSND